MAYVGTPIDTTNQFQSLQGKRFNGDGSTTDFTLDVAPSSTLDIEVFVENVRQDPNSAYTLSGTTLSFTGAPPSGTNNIYVVHQAKAVGTINPPDASVNSDKLTGNLVTPGTLDVNGQELILDADGDTSITADTDDQIDFKTGGTDRVIINSSGNVGIGTSSPTFNNGTGLHLNSSTTDCRFHITNSATGSTASDGAYVVSGGTGDMLLINQENADMLFYTNATERMRILSGGQVLIGKTANDENTNGIRLTEVGLANFARDSGGVLTINRNGTDGTVVDIRGQGTTEGTISISGGTVSYNGFTGTHWSRLADNSKPTILKGTILESLDEMMDWYQVEFNITETDDEGNEITKTAKQSYALGDGESVGDVITYTYEGTDYQATIIQEGDVKHTKSKISNTVDAKNVYGVFVDWDNDDDTVNDMYVAQTGTFVVRLNSSVTTLNKGDLIQSNGDGTGKVQADDIIRASTVAKILSTTKIETYSDGSYIVPCSLHC